ncbi:MAG: phosphoribosylamine--glycine ligase, partial [Anaerolineales bacterium]
MNVLIIGSGGREHAIAWKVKQSPKLTKLYVLPGNPGAAALAENLTGIPVDDHAAIIEVCKAKRIDLVVVGPEAPLANGLSDALSAAGVRCFGPSQAAAQIEASKAFAKDFMARHAIPTARYRTFADIQSAIKHVETIDYPIVIKASGLAAGKGVILPESIEEAKSALESILVKREFGAAGDQVVIEERLSGQEVSLMAFTDGASVRAMIPAQDHKRLLDGDQGPNTGGMGAYAPASICSRALIEAITRSILEPAVSGLKKEGTPFVGVLFAGLILTPGGPRVLEFNCRFGDPETQAVLPLLEADLLEIFDACVDGRLKDMDIRWKAGAAVCVVLASRGYPENPEKGKVARFETLPEGVVCFHAGTKNEDGKVLTAGGRVFGLTAWAGNIESAVRLVYASVDKVSFDGMHYRRDIAHLALANMGSAYSRSGVDIDAGNRAVALMKDAVKATYNSSVLAGIGSFGGLFDASALQQMKKPV